VPSIDIVVPACSVRGTLIRYMRQLKWSSKHVQHFSVLKSVTLNVDSVPRRTQSIRHEGAQYRQQLVSIGLNRMCAGGSS